MDPASGLRKKRSRHCQVRGTNFLEREASIAARCWIRRRKGGPGWKRKSRLRRHGGSWSVDRGALDLGGDVRGDVMRSVDGGAPGGRVGEGPFFTKATRLTD